MRNVERRPNWRKWRTRKQCALWEAIYLSMDIDPEFKLFDFLEWRNSGSNGPSGNVNEEFCQRLESVHMPVSPRLPVYPPERAVPPSQNALVTVDLASTAAYFRRLTYEFPSPPEFLALAGPAEHRTKPKVPMVGILKRAALIEKHLKNWPSIERDLRDGHKNGLSEAAKTSKHGFWWEAGAIEWARARNKLSHRHDLTVNFS